MVFAATLHSIALRDRVPEGVREGVGATWLQAGIAIALTWLTVWIGIVRLRVSKWLPNLGALVKVALFVAPRRDGPGRAAARPPARERLLARALRAGLGRVADLPARAALQRAGLRADELGGRRDARSAPRRAARDPALGTADRGGLHAGRAGHPARGAAGRAEPGHRHLGRAGRARQPVGRRRPRGGAGARHGASCTRAWPTSSPGASA